MKIRNLFLLVPVVVLASGYFARGPGDLSEPNESGLAELSLAAANAATPDLAEPAPARPFSIPEQRIVGDCEIVTHYVPNGDGTVGEVFSCVGADDGAEHPYQSYSDATLESLAYADSKAAEVLGMRLRDSDESRAMSLILRASALSGGDKAPILLYTNSYPHPEIVDDAPVRKTVQVKFVLASVVDFLNPESNYATVWESRIRNFSTDPDTEIAMLHERALKIVEEMRQIQLEVTGTSTIGGLGDA